ncbi:MAG: elongation factor 1-beta [Thermoplasmata archaeon]
MGRVVVTFRVMPMGPEVEIPPIREALRTSFGEDLRDLAEKPVAFGLVGLEAVVLLEDAEGRLEAAESTIQRVAGVGSVETLSVDLV